MIARRLGRVVGRLIPRPARRALMAIGIVLVVLQLAAGVISLISALTECPMGPWEKDAMEMFRGMDPAQEGSERTQIRLGLKHVFTSEPGEKVVGITPFRDGIMIATDRQVLFYDGETTQVVEFKG